MRIKSRAKPGTRVTAGRSARLRDTRFAVASCAVLAAYNHLSGERPWRSRWYVPANACATGVALSAAAASGLTVADVGLGRDAWPPGRLASSLAAAVAAGWLLVAVVPATRPLLDDKRITSLQGRAVAYQAAVRIPIGTVLWEEVAFRGVLQAALRRVMSKGAAVTVTSAVFGIWHVRPTAGALRVNGLADDRGRATAGVLAGVAVTTAAGAFLSWLRERSGRVTAPALVHLAVNSGGLVAAWAVSGRAHLEGPSRSGPQVG
jgi:uncharacterized protein